MRQAGIVAAAGVYALDHHVERLADDHARARRLALGLAEAGLGVDPDRVETNFVQLDVAPLAHARGDRPARRAGRRALGDGAPGLLRAVTHLDVDDEDIDRALEPIPRAAGSPCPRLSAARRARAAAPHGAGGAAAAVGRAPPSSGAASCSGRTRSVSPTSRPKRAASPETQYRIGSITKTFTAVLVLQLRDAGELSLDDPLTDFVPESAARADARPHARARVGPPARAAGRDLGDDAGAEPRGARRGHGGRRAAARAGLLVALLEPRLRPARRGRRRQTGGTLGGRAARARARAARARAHDACRRGAGGARLLRRARTGRRPRRARSRPRRLRRASASSGRHVGDLAAWGAFLAAGDDRVLAAATLEEMSHVRAMVDHERWTLAWGTGLELYRAGDHVFVGHGGAMPGHLAALVVNRTTGDRRRRADEHERRRADPRRWRSTSPSRDRARCPPSRSAGGPASAPPPEIEPLLGRWWTEGHELVFSWRQGRLEAKLVGGAPGRDTSVFEPRGDDRYRCVEGRERGELLRVVRGRGRRPSRSCTSRPTRCRREPSTFGR